MPIDLQYQVGRDEARFMPQGFNEAPLDKFYDVNVKKVCEMGKSMVESKYAQKHQATQWFAFCLAKRMFSLVLRLCPRVPKPSHAVHRTHGSSTCTKQREYGSLVFSAAFVHTKATRSSDHYSNGGRALNSPLRFSSLREDRGFTSIVSM